MTELAARPLISIVVPVLNEAEGIAASLLALQPWRANGMVEILLVDGGSVDGTREAAHPWIDGWLDSLPGRARQMNAGAAAAQGQILLFLHADTALPASFVAALTQAIKAGYQWGRFDVRLSGQAPLFRLIETLINGRSRLTGIATGDQAMFITKALFARAGGFPLQPLMEDIELSRRLKKHTAPCCLRERVITSSRRWEQKGIWRTIFLMWQLRARYALGASPHVLVKRYYG